MAAIRASAVAGLPEIAAGDDLAALIVAAGARPADGEIVVVAHKAISKAEGRTRRLADVIPTARARELAGLAGPGGPAGPEGPAGPGGRAGPGVPTGPRGRDPRQVQVVLDETAAIVRASPAALICRTRHGFVAANAGVDASNAPDGTVVLLPVDPDASARGLRARLRELTGAAPAVLVTDSFGRAWRQGQCDVAIGCAGLAALVDWRGRTDRGGRELAATWIALADAVAAAADLARSKDSGEPVVIVGGLAAHVSDDDGPGAAALVRPLAEDLFT